MFDILKLARDKWSNSEFIIIEDDVNSYNYHYLVVPSQHFNLSHLEFIRSKIGNEIFVTINDNFAKYIDLPLLSTIYEGISSRYQIINGMNSIDNNAVFLNSRAPPISFRDTISMSNEIVDTIYILGDFVDSYENSKNNRYEFIDKFSEKFSIPGRINLLISKRELLKSRLSIIELSLALCEISDNSSSTTIVPIKPLTLKPLQKETEIPIISGKTIINLWRSLKKISKNKIAEPL